MGQSNITELVKNDDVAGSGNEAVAGRQVSVHYTGWLYDQAKADHKGTKFDSSRDRNEPFAFRLGGGQVIQGWDQGVAGMKVGRQAHADHPAADGIRQPGRGRRHPAKRHAPLRGRTAGRPVATRSAKDVRG